MSETAQAKFEGWAVVEMMGHRREVGFVTTEVFGVASLFRVHVPVLPEREFELKRPEWVLIDGEHKHLPAGSKVKRESSPARSVLIGPPAIYAINPCTQEFAMNAIEELIRRPLILISCPDTMQEARLLGGVSPESAAEERVCEECGATPEEGHEEGCSRADDDEAEVA